MSLWILMSAIMIALFVPLAWIAWRPAQTADGSSGKVYADQLEEINREEKAGLIDEADARMARLEVQRRLIATDDAKHLEVSDMNNSDRVTMVAMVASIAIGSAVIYAAVGSPDTPAKPMGSASQRVMSADLAALEGDRPAAAARGGAEALPSVDTMISRLETRLADDPSDAEGWRMLGWSKFRTGDASGAAEAYKRALALEPEDSRVQSVYGEALIQASGGFVSDEAEQALRKAVELDPGDARARFLLGLKKQQDGKAEEALDDWVALLNEAPAGADWYGDVRARAEELAISSGIDVSDRLPPRRAEPAMPAATTSSSAAPRPTQQQVDSAQQMSPDDRQAMILGMVERLDTRLAEEPDDLDGWERLIRSRLVLRQEAEARQAHDQARTQFREDPAALARLDAALATQP